MGGLGTKEQVGLSKAAELGWGWDLSGMDHHRALDDSRMALEILKKVYHPPGHGPLRPGVRGGVLPEDHL